MTIKVKNVKGTIDFSTGIAGLKPTFTADSSRSPLLDSAYTGNNVGDMFWDSANSQLKMFVNDSSGWYNITTTDSAEALTSIPPTPEFRWIGRYYTSSTNGASRSFSFSSMTSATDETFTVQADDTLVLVFSRGNSYGYYPSYTPTDASGYHTYVSGASYSGNDTYDHDHAIFYRTVTSSDITNGYVTFTPQSLGTTSYQACVFQWYVFRGVTGIDNGKGSNYNNRSRYDYNWQHGTTLDDVGQYIVFSHANGWNDYRAAASISSTYSSYYEAEPGMSYWRVSDTDSINVSTWLFKSTSAPYTWSSPPFSSPSYTTASDATLVSCRVY